MPRTALGPALGGGVIMLEGPIHHLGPHLEHQMRTSRRPAHLLLRVQRAARLTPEGREAVRTWLARQLAGNVTRFPRIFTEAGLAHVVGATKLPRKSSWQPTSLDKLG